MVGVQAALCARSRCRRRACGISSRVTLVNLSEGGAFVRSDDAIPKGENVRLDFKVFTRDFEVLGQIVHTTRLPGLRPQALGIQFAQTQEVKRQMSRLIQAFELIGISDTRAGNEVSYKDFAQWASGLEALGEGLAAAGAFGGRASRGVARTLANNRAGPRYARRAGVAASASPAGGPDRDDRGRGARRRAGRAQAS